MSNHIASPPQVRAARGLLGWSQTTLASCSELALQTVIRFETGRGARVSEESQAKITAALEAAGVEFIAENGGGAGVRLRKPAARGTGKAP